MDIRLDKNGEEIFTTVIGDFLIRWGIFSMVGGLLFAVAMNAKDFEKNRLKHLQEAGSFLEQKKDQLKTNCISDIREIVNTVNLVNYDLIKLSENNFKMNDKKTIAINSKDKKLFYTVKLCEKLLEDFNKLEMINE